MGNIIMKIIKELLARIDGKNQWPEWLAKMVAKCIRRGPGAISGRLNCPRLPS